MDFGTVFVEFRSNVDKFTRELRQVGFQLNVMESLAKNQEQVWRAVATTAFYFSRKMTDDMLGLAEAAGEVDQKMAGLRTVLKATDAEFENLKNTAREWSNEHITSVNDLLEASYNMASAGLNISQVMATMKNASILAAGAYGTMEQATSLLTNAMNVFGKTMPSYISDMSKADEMTNVFAYTVQKFKIILPQLESGMARIAGVASAFGFDMSEAAIALGALTTAGLSAEQAGTAIKNFYERSAKAAKEMGLQVFDSSGKIRGLYDLLGDIKQYYGGAIDSAEEFAHAQGIFTTRGSQVITILQGISEELRNNSIEAKNSATATELAAEVEQGFSAQMTILSNNLNNLKVAFGEGLTVTIKLVADGLGALYSILQAMPGWIQAVISTFLLFSSVAITVVAGVAMIRKSFGALISQIKTLLLSVPILGTVLKAAFSPVGLGIMAAVTAISIVIDLISKQKEETIKVNEEIAKQAKEVVNLYTTYKASENAMKNNTKFAEEFLSVQKELEKYLPESSKTKIAAVKIDGSDEEILKAISEELDKIGEKSRELTKNTLEIEIAGEWDKLIKTNEELNKMKVIKNEIGDLEARYNEIVQARSNLPEGYTTERFEAAAQIGNKINELDDTFKKLGLTIIDSKGKLKEYDLIVAEIAIAFNDISQEAETLQSKINDLSDTSLGLSDAQFKFRTEILGAFKEIENSVDPVNTKVEKLGWLIKRVEEHQAAGGGAQDILKVLIEGYDKLTAKVRAYEEELAKVSVVALETFNKLSDIESVNIALGISGEATLEEQIKVLEKALSDLSAKALEAIQNGEELDDVYVNTYTAIVNKLKEKQKELISFYEQSSKTIADKFSGITLENAIDVSDIIDIDSAKAQYNELKNIYDDLKEYVKSFNSLKSSFSIDKDMNFNTFGDSIESSSNRVSDIRIELDKVIEKIKTFKNAGLEVPPVFGEIYNELKRLFYIESLNDIMIQLKNTISEISSEFNSARSSVERFISSIEGTSKSGQEQYYDSLKNKLYAYADALDKVTDLKEKYIASGGKESSVLYSLNAQINSLSNSMASLNVSTKVAYEALREYQVSVQGILEEKLGGVASFDIEINIAESLNTLQIELEKIQSLSAALGYTQEETADKMRSAYTSVIEKLSNYRTELQLLGKDTSIVSSAISVITTELKKYSVELTKTASAMEVVRKEISSLREIGDVLNKPLSEIESSVVSTLESKITSLINSKGEGTKTAEELKEINNQVKELEKQYNEAKSAQAYYEEQEKFTEKLKSDFDSIKNSMPDLTSQFEDIKFDKDTFGTSEVDSLNKSLDATKNKINGLYNTMKEYPIGSDIYNAISQEIDSLKSIYDEIAIKLVKQDIKDIVKESNDNIDIQSELSVIFNEDSLSQVQNEINEIRSRITSLVEKKYEIEDMAISDSAKKSLIGEVQSTIAEATAELNSLKSVEIQAKVDVISTDFESKIRELEQYGEVLGKNIPQAKLEAATNQLQELISLESELIGKADLAPIRAQIDATIEKIKQLKQEALDAFAFETTTNLNVELENDSFISSLLGESELEQVEGTISQLESAFSSLADKRSEALSEGLDTTQLDVSLVSLANQLNIEKEKLDVLEAQEKAKEELAALEKEIEAILSGEEFNKTLSIDLEFGELTGAKESEQLETQIGAYEGRLRELLELKQKNSEQGLDNGEIQTEISETVSELDKLKLKLEEVKNLEIYNDSIKKFNEELATSTEYIKYMTQGATDLSMQMGDAFLNQLDDLVRFRSELVATGKPIRDIDQNIKDTTGNIKEWADALLATDFSESLNAVSTSVSNIGSYFETAKTIYDVRKELELTTAVSKELGDIEEEVGKKRYEAIQSALEALIEYKNNLILTGQGSSEEIGKLNQQIKEYQEEKSKYEEQEKQKAAEAAVAEAEEESLENLKAKLEEISDIRAKAFERKFDLDSFLGKPESIENRVNKIVSSLQELYEMEFDDLSVDVENAEGAEGSFRKTIDNTSKAIAAQQSAIAELRAELKKLLEERFKDVLEDLRVSNVQSAMSFEIFGDELGNLTNQLNSTKTAIEDLLVLKQEAIESPAIEWTAENEDTLQGLKNTYEELEEQVKKAEKIKSITSDIAGTVKSAFGDFVGALKSGTSLDKAMKDLKKNLKNNLKEAILNALLESLIQSAAMQEKFEKIGNMIFEALEDGVISSSEQTGLNDLIGDITDQADQIAGVIGSTFEGLDIGIDSKDLFDIATLESSLSSTLSQFATDLETMSFDKAWKKTAESLETEIKKSIINAMIESIIQSAAMKSKMEALGEMIGDALKDGIISGSEQANIDILTGSLLNEAENAAKVIAELLNSMGMSKDSKNKQKTQTFDAVSNNDSRGLYFEPVTQQTDISSTVEDAKESIDLFSNYLKEIATGDVYGYSKLPDGIIADPGALWDPIEKFEETAGRLLSSINDKTKYSVPQETEERLRELLALQQENSRNKQEPLYYALTIDSGAIVINSSVENEELLAEEIIKRIKSEAEMKVRTSGGRLI